VDLADRRIEIDHHRSGARARPRRPRPADRLGDHRVELADVSEGEGPKERAERRGCHHPKRQHATGRPGPQTIGVVDVGGSGQDRGDEREHLAPRPGAADAARQPHQPVHQGLEPEAHHQRRRQHKPRVRHQRRIVEGHLDAIDRARY
jgi:hypothetical protein